MPLHARVFAFVAAAAVVSATFAQDAVTRYPRMYTVNYDAWLESAQQRLHEYGLWHDPGWLNAQNFADFEDCSHGLLKMRPSIELDLDDYPIMRDGYRYTDAAYQAAVDLWFGTGSQAGFHLSSGVDYKALMLNFDFARRVDFGEIDEVNNNCAPFLGYWETNMSGYGGYWCNSGPTQRIACSRIYVITGFNYERGVAEMLHSNGHRAESIMSRTYGSWSTNRDLHLWDRYGWNLGQTTISNVYGVGSDHFPPNGMSDYDYANPLIVDSYAPAWMNEFPAFNGKDGTTAQVNRETWGGPDYHRTFMKWWYAHMPHVGGRNTHDGYDRLNNWWEYLFNFNNYPESGGDHAAGGSPPPAVPADLTVQAITANTYDDWRPQVNAAGRVVWAGRGSASNPMMVYSANADGTDRKQHSLFGKVSEMPQINNAGTIVYQSFDNRDFEIYTASTTGGGLKRITGNTVQDWHPDINDSNRIVWEGFDGEDYEIFSANADGTDLVQITNNTHGGVGKPRDDMWPRINNAGRVVWMGYNGSRYQIYSANADGSDLVNVSFNAVENEFPQISEDGLVVWHAWHTDQNAEVYVGDALTGVSTRVTSNNVMDWWPQINTAGEMVWMRRMAGDWEIMYRSAGGAISPLTNNSTHDQYPVIDDDGRVVWQGFDGNDWEIYAHENGVIYQITDNDYDDRAPALYTGGAIAWHGESELGDPGSSNYQGTSTEIFTATAAPPLCAGDLNCDGVIDFDDIDPFVAALGCQGGDPNCWDPACPWLNGDCNDDETVDFDDIDPFVARIGATCP